jgi:hypothetical protein
VISGALQSSSESPTSPIEYLTHGFQVSAMLQAYSALPLNITSGVTTIQARRPGRSLMGRSSPEIRATEALS